MRGDDRQQDAMFSYVSPEARVPLDVHLHAGGAQPAGERMNGEADLRMTKRTAGATHGGAEGNRDEREANAGKTNSCLETGFFMSLLTPCSRRRRGRHSLIHGLHFAAAAEHQR